MANYFDQFDPPAKAVPNYFDTFDTPALPPGFELEAKATAALPPGFELEPARAAQPQQSPPGTISLPFGLGTPSLIGTIKGLLSGAQSATTLPRDVYQGKVDPLSE